MRLQVESWKCGDAHKYYFTFTHKIVLLKVNRDIFRGIPLRVLFYGTPTIHIPLHF